MDLRRLCWLPLCIMFAFAPSNYAQVASSDREAAGLAAERAGQLAVALDNYVAALQAMPHATPADADRRLREHIIRVALKLDPPPAIPGEAQQRITSGQAAAKSAGNPGELGTAAAEFQRALRIAPWLATGYFNLGELQEKLRDYPAAIGSFELYLLSAPAAQDAESVQKRITNLRGRFAAMYLKTHSIFTQSALRPAWAMDSDGELTVSDGSIQFRDTSDAKHSFAFQVSDLRSLEAKRGPEGFHVLHMKLQNGKKFDLVPDAFPHLIATGEKSAEAMEKAMDESMDAIEKAIKNMASQHGVVLN